MTYIYSQHIVDPFGVLVLPSNEDPQQSGENYDKEVEHVARGIPFNRRSVVR